MHTKVIVVLYLLCCSFVTAAQEKLPGYTLGSGLLRLNAKTLPISWQDTIPVYRDPALTQLWTNLTIEQTNCPECMACAEPERFYQGPFHPFICGGRNGPSFICTRSGNQFHEIITDSSGTRAYVPVQYGAYDTWEQYILGQAKQGDYFRIIRDWDSTVLYDKPYAAEALPAAGSGFMSGVSFADISDFKFYPVAVQGTWMKLKAVSGRKAMGYCWIIWRNENHLYKWFAWHAD